MLAVSGDLLESNADVLTIAFQAEKHKGTFLAPVGIGLSLFIAEMAGKAIPKIVVSYINNFKVSTTPVAP